jgi:hypothetical protein
VDLVFETFACQIAQDRSEEHALIVRVSRNKENVAMVKVRCWRVDR